MARPRPIIGWFLPVGAATSHDFAPTPSVLGHKLNLDDLVSRRISLRQVNDGYAALKEGSLNRVVVTSF